MRRGSAEELGEVGHGGIGAVSVGIALFGVQSESGTKVKTRGAIRAHATRIGNINFGEGGGVWILYLLIALLVGYGLLLYLSPSRPKALAEVASAMGHIFDAKVSRERLCVKGATFDVGAVPRNCIRGQFAGRETVVFDQIISRVPPSRPSAETGGGEQTIVGFRVPANSYCRDRGINQPSAWHLEKMGQWVFMSQPS